MADGETHLMSSYEDDMLPFLGKIFDSLIQTVVPFWLNRSGWNSNRLTYVNAQTCRVACLPDIQTIVLVSHTVQTDMSDWDTEWRTGWRTCLTCIPDIKTDTPVWHTKWHACRTYWLTYLRPELHMPARYSGWRALGDIKTDMPA